MFLLKWLASGAIIYYFTHDIFWGITFGFCIAVLDTLIEGSQKVYIVNRR